MIPYSLHSIGKEEEDAVLQVMRSGWLTGGPKVQEFEERFAEYVGARHAVAVNSCAAALYLAIKATFPGRGAYIAVPALTYVATANAVVLAGHVPKFIDVDPLTFCMDPEKIEKVRPDGVIPMHYGGHPCDMDSVEAGKWKVIQDAAHAVGSAYMGRKIGSWGTACFSFHPCKNMTTAEGGIITTDDQKVASWAKCARLNGILKDGLHQDMAIWGFKWNMNEISAAIGIEQLKKVEAMNERRRQIARHYEAAFINTTVEEQCQMPWAVNSRHLFPILVNDRDEVAKKLQESGVGCAIHYTPVHLMSWYRKFNHHPGDFPVAEDIARKELSIPLFPSMTDGQVEYVIDAVKRAVE